MKKELQMTLKTSLDDDPVAVIEQLADQLAQEGFYGIQDANLLLAEALRELRLNNEFQADTCLSTLVKPWLDLIGKFQDEPKQTVTEIVNYLRRPELKISMAEDEFNILSLQLFNDANYDADANGFTGDIDIVNGEDNVRCINEQQLVDEHIAIAERLAEQSAATGLYGLQDANLLLVEALREIVSKAPVVFDTYFLSLLSGWAELIDRYGKNQEGEAETIINFLRHPILKIQLSDDEFAILKDQLTTESCESELNKELADSNNAAVLAFHISEEINSSNERFSVVSRAAQELVELLLLESQQVRSYLQSIVIDNRESVLNGLQQAGYELERFANASKIAGFEGLARVCIHINLNMQLFVEQIDIFSNDRLSLLLDWLTQVQEYLPSFNESNAGQLLVTGLTDDQWLLPLPFEDMTVILQQIRNETSVFGDQSKDLRIENATDEEVSLALPNDVNQELLELLLQELPVQTHQFSEAVQRLQSGGNKEDVETAQRVAHTLKGSANTVGIKGIAVLTHHLEDILTACANEQMLPGRALVNSLVNASDCLESMSEALISCSSPPDDAKAVLQEILNWANRIDKAGLVRSEAEVMLSETQKTSEDKAESIEKLSPTLSQEASIRVASYQIDNLFRLSGESIILNSQAQESMRYMKKQLQAMKLQFSLLQQLGIELEQLIDLKDLTGRSLGTVNTGFDALEMDQYNELHTASRRMAEAAIDAREISLDVNKELDKMNEVLDDQQRLVINVQEMVMQTRLVSIATIAPRLQRSLRQTCRMTGKQSKLTLIGENIMIDGDTLNAMIDPLLHLLRNAVDHGIEISDERLAQGKSINGHISFEFERDGNNILVRCRDDGRGLDYEAIRMAAEKRGILQPGEDVTDEELKHLILRPNFSSRSVSTQTSGRGVGMDVVYNQIVNMGGTLTLDSETGRGMVIELRVPLPLSLTYALITNVGRYRVAIASKGIIQIVYALEGELMTLDGKETLFLDGNTYPAARLIDLLNITDHRKVPRPYSAVLLVQNEGSTTAVLTDAISDSLDVVIKGLGYYIEKIPGYIGATILGDGAVTPVLDIPELLKSPARAMSNVYTEQLVSASSISSLPTVLVVDDSLSQRRALEQLLSDAGYRVRTARDGIEAAEILVDFKPDIILTDLEMPRMNGIELTSHIRTQEKIKSLPVVMITSRTTQKHRQMAEKAGVDFYFTKPVRDETLLIKMRTLMESLVEQGREIA